MATKSKTFYFVEGAQEAKFLRYSADKRGLWYDRDFGGFTRVGYISIADFRKLCTKRKPKQQAVA